MDITGISSISSGSGLQATGAAISKAQDRFADTATKLVDEHPAANKDIHRVMAAQADLVEVIGEFNPRLVKMAPHGERAED